MHKTEQRWERNAMMRGYSGGGVEGRSGSEGSRSRRVAPVGVSQRRGGEHDVICKG